MPCAIGRDGRVIGAVWREKCADVFGLRNGYRLAREGEIEAIEIDHDGQHHACIFADAIRHQDRIEHLLACFGMDLQEPAVAGREDVVVVGL